MCVCGNNLWQVNIMLYKLYRTSFILNLDIVFLKHNNKPFDYSHAQNGTSHISYVYPSSEIKGYTSKITMSHVVPMGSLMLHCTSWHIFLLLERHHIWKLIYTRILLQLFEEGWGDPSNMYTRTEPQIFRLIYVLLAQAEPKPPCSIRSMSQVQLKDIQSQKSKVVSSKSHHIWPPVVSK